MGALDALPGRAALLAARRVGPDPRALPWSCRSRGSALTVRARPTMRSGRGPRCSRRALLAMPPDFLLFWAHEARKHYPLTLLLGNPRAPPRAAGARRARRAGLAPVRAPRRRPRARLLDQLPLARLLPGRRGPAPAPRASAARAAAWPRGAARVRARQPAALALRRAARDGACRRRAGPCGLETCWPTSASSAGRRGRSWPACRRPSETRRWASRSRLALGALLPDRGPRRPPRCPPGARPAGAAALALVVLACTNVGVAVATQYGRGLDDNDPHYLLPLYTALPPLLGWFLAGLADRRRARLLAAAAPLGPRASAPSAGASRISIRPSRRPSAPSSTAQLATVEGLERAGIHRLYDSDATGRVFTFLSAGRTIVSNPYEEIRPGFARAVDGAAAAAWWCAGAHAGARGALRGAGRRASRSAA